MKRVILAGLGLLLAGAAWAEPPKAPVACINPHKSYIAHPLNEHDLYVIQSIGRAKPPVRLKTSCHNLGPAIAFGLSSPFNCLGLGDTVVATIVDGHRESCVVTRVLTYTPEEGDSAKY